MTIVRNFQKNKIYHIYSRGVEKRLIFLDEEDYFRFYKSIFVFNSNKSKIFSNKYIKQINDKELVQIISFELMPNHFHMKLKELKKGAISKYMQKLLTSYTMYFNQKYERFGSLLGTTFKSKLVDSVHYSKYLDFYIKNNCIKIIRPGYNIYDIFCGNIILTKKEFNFVKNYKYYFINH
jgi:putative transposase